MLPIAGCARDAPRRGPAIHVYLDAELRRKGNFQRALDHGDGNPGCVLRAPAPATRTLRLLRCNRCAERFFFTHPTARADKDVEQWGGSDAWWPHIVASLGLAYKVSTQDHEFTWSGMGTFFGCLGKPEDFCTRVRVAECSPRSDSSPSLTPVRAQLEALDWKLYHITIADIIHLVAATIDAPPILWARARAEALASILEMEHQTFNVAELVYHSIGRALGFRRTSGVV